MATASSCITAANLGGHTMHSSVKLGIRQKQLPPHVREPIEVLNALWDPVLCVFADELSMTEIGFFGLWEEALRHVKNCPDPFGGIITVLMFDFFQLETISGYQLYKLPAHKRPFSELQLRGSWLYRSIDKVVYLTRNMRFANDPEWGEWLELARRGNWCTAMRVFLQQAPPPAGFMNALSGDFAQVISTDNAMQKHVNDPAVQIATRAFVSRTGNIPVFLKAYIGQ
ncbi:hypothetical protein KRP22_012468 [Phytophthora ramorum]|nr:ATP-dependent DNA helicase PIF1 [Phytophthora ramorum]